MIIYIAENKINGKKYIGQTIKSLEERKRRHIYLSNYNPKTYFQKALKKYGSNNFTFKIIEECVDISQLNEREQYWIKEYNTLSPNGYNLNTGGKNHNVSETTKKDISNTLKQYYKNHKSKSIGFKHTDETKKNIKEKNTGKKRSDETKEKLRKANLGKTLSNETKEKLRKASLGKIGYWKNKKFDSEYRKKLSESAKKRDNTNYSWCFKPVICLDTGKIYKNIEEASKILNICRSSIGACCNKKRKSAGKLHFDFYKGKYDEIN